MGKLNRFNLDRIIKEFKIDYFFETGTWKGDGLNFAAKYKFKHLYSSEIMPDFAKKAISRFIKDNRIEIINDNSISALKNTMDKINGNCIFWLDAHYPGADEGLYDYNSTNDEFIRLPLEEEVKIIYNRVNQFMDVILIDDLRIYEDGPFKYGNISNEIIPPKVRNINFIYDLFSETHVIKKSYADEGYIFLVPRKKVSKINLLTLLVFAFKNRLLNKIY